LFLFEQIFLLRPMGSTDPISGQTHWCEFDWVKLTNQQTSRGTRWRIK
jgi:hypothetical protein